MSVCVYASLHMPRVNQKDGTFLDTDEHDPLPRWNDDHPPPSSPNTASRS